MRSTNARICALGSSGVTGASVGAAVTEGDTSGLVVTLGVAVAPGAFVTLGVAVGLVETAAVGLAVTVALGEVVAVGLGVAVAGAFVGVGVTVGVGVARVIFTVSETSRSQSLYSYVMDLSPVS